MKFQDIKATMRSLFKNKWFTIINILGISIATVCIILLLSWIQYERSYDQFNIKKDRIYRIKSVFDQKDVFPAVPSPLVEMYKENFPQIEEISRLYFQETYLNYQQGKIKEKRFAYADASFFKIFSFPLVTGDYRSLDEKAHAILLSESMAKKYFAGSNPLGESIVGNDSIVYEIVGVFKDVPANSHIKFDFVASFNKNVKDNIDWGNWNYFAYILLPPNGSIPELKNETVSWGEKNKARFPNSENYFKFIEYQKVTDIHFESLRGDFEQAIDKRLILAAGIVVIFILLIAGINFMNLSIINTFERFKEIGIKKVFGIKYSQGMLIILKETLMLSLISFAIGIFLTRALLPVFNHFTTSDIQLSFFDSLIMISFMLIVVACVLSSLYPAHLFSRVNPVSLLRKSSSFKKLTFIKLMVFVQIVLSIILLCSILIINHQMQFIKNKDKGFDSEQVVNIKLENGLANRTRFQIKNEVLKIPLVMSASLHNCDFVDNKISYMSGFNWVGAKTNIKEKSQENIWVIYADKDFFKTLNINILEGKETIDNQEAETSIGDNKFIGVVFNQAALKRMEDTNMGRMIDFFPPFKLKTTGIMADFNFRSLHFSVEPTAVALTVFNYQNQLSVRMRPGNHQETIDRIGKIVKSFAPGYPFEYSFLDQEVNGHYQSEQRTFSILVVSCFICMFLSCLGILGIISYSTRKRVKEIGIRKVNGSNVWEIMLLISKDIIWLTLVAFVVAVPIVYYFMSDWISRFAYRASLSWWLFAMGGLIALFIALLTVSWQSWRAARRNPVEALRYE